MLSRPYSFLFTISYFGARFKGWAKQKGQPTVEGKLERVLRYVLGHEDFRILGSSRTDSGVNCRQGYVQIFLREKVDLESLLPALNQNLSGEIRLESVQVAPRAFNLISSVRKKTYRYFFAIQEGFHPFASAYITAIDRHDSLEQMQEKAQLFLGMHDFRAFCKMSPSKSDFVREILEAKVYLTEYFQGNFFPERVYCFEVTGTGFLYNQVRKMVAAIWNFTSEEILERLARPEENWEAVPTAPARGLTLWETEVHFEFEV